MSSQKRLSLKKRLTRELTLWALFALDSECLSHGMISPLPLLAWRNPEQLPKTRLLEQITAWREDASIWRLCFSHIKNKVRLQQIWESDHVWEQIKQDVEHILQHQSAIDTLVSRSAIRWKLNRMGSIDRTILRFGAYELCFRDDLPAKAILSEAIELGKRYGSADSGRFINGVLDKVAQELGRIERRDHSGVKVSVVHRKR
jgi:transcription antitermination protein NusB